MNENERNLSFWEREPRDIDLDPTSKDTLRERFEKRLAEIRERDEEEHTRLMGELVEWGACIPGPGSWTLWDLIESQIRPLAEEKKITPEEFIDLMFAPVQGRLSAEMIMMRLQVGVSFDDL